MRLARKAAFCRDLVKRVVGYHHQVFGPLDSLTYYIPIWRTPKMFFEDSSELTGTKVQDTSEIHHSNGGMQICSDIPLDAAGSP
jgi:hypothetical protein